MKTKLIILILFLGASLNLKAQDDQQFQTLFKKDGKTRVSGFGGFSMEFSGIDGEFAYSLGGEGAILFNQSFFFGGYGLGTVNFPPYSYPQPSVSREYNSILFGHGGFYTGFIFGPNNPIHFGISSKFGWGGITIMDNYNGNYYNPPYPPYPGYPYNDYEVDQVFVITPQVEAEVNIAKWFKFNMGLGYRVVTGVDATYSAYADDGSGAIEQVPYFDSNAFNSFTLQLGFYFGWFK
jgi:hypothetical protein